ncbi:MAG: HAD family hydrolase [Firmicutes bacterium]|nr:HAD family hydrolase [Bacillota bacterium]
MALIFDFDGTLHNTAHLYGCAFRKAYAWLVEQGQAPAREYTDEEVSVWLGVSAPDMWKSFMPQLADPIWQQASTIIGREMVQQIKEGQALLYPGIPEALEELRSAGWRLLILSNYRHAYMEAHREFFGLDRWFDGYYCAEDFGFIPKEDIYDKIAADYPQEEHMIIGDRDSDFRVGLTHGRPVIGCKYGFGTAEELLVCNAVIDSPAALPDAVRRLSAGLLSDGMFAAGK